MATTISTQDIVDAKRDIDDIGEAVNEMKIVSPRYGEDFKSMPMLAAESQGKINEWQDAINTITVNDGVPALAVSDASGVTQQEINDLTGAPYRLRVGGYNIGERVVLENGDIVQSIVAGNTVDPNVDMTWWFNQSSEQRALSAKQSRDYVTPYDFGYADGLDYGHYLQLAINSGNTVKGSFKKETVTAKTSVKVSTDGQEVDLSMISVNLDNIAGAADRAVSFVNLQPSDLSPFSWINGSGVMPQAFTNTFSLSDASSLNVGDYIVISVTHAAENSISRPAFITEKSGNSISTDYVFGLQPTTLRVSKVNYVRDCTVKMPIQLIDLSTDTVDETKMIGGLRAVRAVNCKLHGTELLNGANPALMYLHSHGCEDSNFKTTNPRIKTAGRGYAVQVSYSTKIESWNPTGHNSRHAIDYTGSCYCNNYNASEPKPQHPPLLTHGAYEHDINYVSPRIGDCSLVSGGYAVAFAGADAYFGNVSIRCKVIDARCGGGFWMSPTSKGCSIEGEFKTLAFNQCSSSTTLEVNTNGSGVIVNSAEVSEFVIKYSKIANLVLQENVGAVTIQGSSLRDIRTTGATKPKSIDVIEKSVLNPTLDVSNNIELQEHFKIASSSVVGSAVNAGYYFNCPIVSISSDVTIRNSVNFHAVASNYFEFSGKFEDVDTRTTRTPNTPLVQQRSETGTLLMNNPILRTQGGNSIVPFRVSSTSQAFVSAPLIINGGYIEGVSEVPNHVSLGKLDCVSINGTVFKDDSAILAITPTSKIKINGIKL